MITALLLLTLGIGDVLEANVAGGEQICNAPAVRLFYSRRALNAAWDDRSIAALLSALDHLENEGLNPARYHRVALERLPAGPEQDVLATDAFVLAATHLSQGVVDPQFVRPRWCAPPARLDLAAVLEAALAEGTVEQTLLRLATKHEGYLRLRKALASYKSVDAAGGWPVVPAGRSLRLHDDDLRVNAIRQRLGDHSESTVFDEELDDLVRHFQAHHGITVDGIVGPETLREMNISAADRVLQIAANMERWRWMPDALGPSYVIVNIAGFRLDVIEGDHSVLSMKTVVGKEYTRTPFFAAQITEVLLNPWWNVPDSIADKELWPKQRRDPSTFAREHMIVSGGRIRQRPGPWNALGRIKFNLPNSYDVYLHDTPARSLFELPFRAFSHGCIRLERPLDLAVYLLRDQPGRDAASIEEAIATETEQTIRLTVPEPVYVLYWTAWVGDDGHVEFMRDHYDRDAALIQALQ